MFILCYITFIRVYTCYITSFAEREREAEGERRERERGEDHLPTKSPSYLLDERNTVLNNFHHEISSDSLAVGQVPGRLYAEDYI